MFTIAKHTIGLSEDGLFLLELMDFLAQKRPSNGMLAKPQPRRTSLPVISEIFKINEEGKKRKPKSEWDQPRRSHFPGLNFDFWPYSNNSSSNHSNPNSYKPRPSTPSVICIMPSCDNMTVRKLHSYHFQFLFRAQFLLPKFLMSTTVLTFKHFFGAGISPELALCHRLNELGYD